MVTAHGSHTGNFKKVATWLQIGRAKVDSGASAGLDITLHQPERFQPNLIQQSHFIQRGAARSFAAIEHPSDRGQSFHTSRHSVEDQYVEWQLAQWRIQAEGPVTSPVASRQQPCSPPVGFSDERGPTHFAKLSFAPPLLMGGINEMKQFQ